MELCETDCLVSGVWSLTSGLFKCGWKLERLKTPLPYVISKTASKPSCTSCV